MKIIIDDRERAIIPFFAPLRVETEVKRIHVGDYAVEHENNIVFVIERKTWKDLSASIKDGRKENINKLINFRDETGCKLFYIIEGKPRYAPSFKFAGIAYSSLLAHLDHIIIRDNIHVIYSKDAEDTAVRLTELCNNYRTLLPYLASASPEPQKTGGNNEKLYVAPPITDERIIYDMWSAIKGVTTKTAAIFINKGWHITDFIRGTITAKDIAVLKYPSGAVIGEKRAKKIAEVSDPKKSYATYCNILSAIPTITKKTAVRLLMEMDFLEIINGADLKHIQKTEKTKLGKKSEELIHKFLYLP